MRIVVGIDSGTITSAIAALVDGRPEAAENHEGERVTPSVVYNPKDGPPIVGERARNMMLVKSSHCCWEVKRLMGQDVVAFTHPDTGQKHSPVEVNGIILAALKAYAEEYFGQPIADAVISVPAYFDDKSRHATAEAAKLAGLKVLKIGNEPTMALLAYRHQHPDMPDGIYAVGDCGGGTVDVTIAEVRGDAIKTLTTDGDRRLGGTDYTLEINALVLERFKKAHGIEFDPNVPEDAACLQDIRERAEKAKRELSKLPETVINVMAKGKQLTVELTRQEFEERCRPLTDTVREKFLSAVQGGVGEITKLDDIVLVGGATRMPCIQQMTEELAGGEVPILKDVSADLAVAYGCAIEAYRLSGLTEFTLPVKKVQDVTSLNIGVAAHRVGDRNPDRMYVGCILPKGTSLPVEKSRDFGLASMPAGAGQEPELVLVEGTEGEEYREEMKFQAFGLGDLPPSSDPREPAVRVTISVNESGIIEAEATHLPTGKKIRKQVERNAIQ